MNGATYEGLNENMEEEEEEEEEEKSTTIRNGTLNGLN